MTSLKCQTDPEIFYADIDRPPLLFPPHVRRGRGSARGERGSAVDACSAVHVVEVFLLAGFGERGLIGGSHISDIAAY